MSTSNSTSYDYIIIGSGQAGNPLAAALARTSKRTLLIEKSTIGGTCVNVGCTPTKTLIAGGRVAYLAKRAKDYGVVLSSTDKGDGEGDGVEIDMLKFRQRKRDIVASFRGGNEKKLKDAGVEVWFGEARFLDASTVSVKMNAGSSGSSEEVRTAKSPSIFINTGERPTDPRIPGVEKVNPARVLDSTRIQELDAVPAHLVVVGGGYVGLEFGQLFRRLGSKVTIVTRGKQVLPREDPDVAEEMKKILEQDGITIQLHSQTTKMDAAAGGDGVKLFYKSASAAEENVVEGSHILFAAGRTPNTDTLNLKAAGIETNEKGYIKCDEFLQTSAAGVYVIGDAKGGPAFTHISYDDYRIIQNNIITPTVSRLSTTNRQVPYTVYTDPQLGHIGLHETAARAQYPNRNIKIAKIPMSWVARALETDESRGLMKATVDADTGEILGFTCLGLDGGEVMSMVQIAMMGGVKYWQLRDATFAHPALAEGLNTLFGAVE